MPAQELSGESPESKNNQLSGIVRASRFRSFEKLLNSERLSGDVRGPAPGILSWSRPSDRKSFPVISMRGMIERFLRGQRWKVISGKGEGDPIFHPPSQSGSLRTSAVFCRRV